MKVKEESEKVGFKLNIQKTKTMASSPITWENVDFSNLSGRNAGLDDSQAGNKTAGRNISNLRYADDITLMAEIKGELKSLLMRVKEESEKASLKFSAQKTKIMASGSITSWQIEGENVEAERDFIFLGSKINANGDCSQEI